MINAELLFANMVNSPVRRLRARVELLSGSTLVDTFRYNDRLISFTVDRVGENSKFFGFGICQKINVKVLDTDRKLSITTANIIDAPFGVGSDYIYPFPHFKVTEVHRDENTNELSITAYDKLYEASNYTVSELKLLTPYSIREFADYCARMLNLPLRLVNITGNVFDTEYINGANFEGTETLREALDAIAEATQTIYYINCNNELIFKRLDRDGKPVEKITKAKYFSLDSGDNRRLATITHATELGDNVHASTTAAGSTQYVRDNPFYELRDDVGAILESAVDVIGGLTINQFECDWRGNFLLEIGDKIALTTKDNKEVTSFVLDDVLTYNGAFSQKTQWSYTDNSEESESNPSTLGDAIKYTYARVDKANREIELVASETEENSESIAAILLNTESISASVKDIQETADNSFSAVNESIETLTKQIEATMTAEAVKLEIQSELANGTNKVVTSTGFTFDDSGLTVEKSGSEMSTKITEDGMTVYRNDDAVLTADNTGVDAVNLRASTYLIIGKNSRFEDIGSNRTGCFWIGG